MLNAIPLILAALIAVGIIGPYSDLCVRLADCAVDQCGLGFASSLCARAIQSWSSCSI